MVCYETWSKVKIKVVKTFKVYASIFKCVGGFCVENGGE